MVHAAPTWVAPSADGRLEVFVIGIDTRGDTALWHLWQTAPNGGWSHWFSHGLPSGSAGLRWSPAVAPSVDGRLELFAVGDDLQPEGLGNGGALNHQWQTAPNNGWSNWLSHGTGGPNLFGSPAVARSADGRLELFVLGIDGALWHRSQAVPGNGWSEWFSHGTPPGVSLNSAPAVAVSADGRLEVFIVGEEATLWHIGQSEPNDGWSDWFSHGTPSGVLFGSDSTPAIAPSADGRLELFTVGNDGALWHMSQVSPGAGWSDWQCHDAPPGVKFQRLRPAVASGPDGRLELFIVGDGEDLWHMWQTAPNGGWSQWVSHGVPPVAGLTGCPAVAPSADGRLELFVVGTDGALWHMWQKAPNNVWSQWFSHGAPPGFPLVAALTTG
jgi:hypothetical protein